MLNFFKKKKKKEGNKVSQINEALDKVDTSGMTRMQKIAMGMFKKMSAEKQQQILRKAMNPQNIQKDKDKILKQINEMVKSGQIDKGQAEAMKSQLGLR
jgi:hypothetical protein